MINISEKITCINIVITVLLSAQLTQAQEQYTNFITPEYTLGKTSITNTGFPDVGLHSAFFINFGSYQNTNTNEWVFNMV